jgi:hypothetical protein
MSTKTPNTYKLCSFCSIILSHAKICSGCHIQSYCDKACQKKDWINHREFCGKNKNKQLLDEVSQTIDNMTQEWRIAVKKMNNEKLVPVFMINPNSYKHTLLNLNFETSSFGNIKKMYRSYQKNIDIEDIMETSNMMLCGIIIDSSLRLIFASTGEIGYIKLN